MSPPGPPKGEPRAHEREGSPPGDPVRYVSCPRCGAQVAWVPASAFRPFCSERCRMVDLGAWATEQYRVPAEPEREGPVERRADETE